MERRRSTKKIAFVVLVNINVKWHKGMNNYCSWFCNLLPFFADRNAPDNSQKNHKFCEKILISEKYFPFFFQFEISIFEKIQFRLVLKSGSTYLFCEQKCWAISQIFTKLLIIPIIRFSNLFAGRQDSSFFEKIKFKFLVLFTKSMLTYHQEQKSSK